MMPRSFASGALFVLTALLAAPLAADAAPDLQVEITAVDKGPPSTVTLVVRNLGDSAAGESKVGLLLDAGVATKGLKAPTRRLAAGGEITLAIPAPLVPGLKLRALADADDSVAESDEDNNWSRLWRVELSGRQLVLVAVEDEAAENATEESEEDQAEGQPTEPEVGEPIQQGETEDSEEIAESTEPAAPAEVRPPPQRQPDLSPRVIEVRSGEKGVVLVEVANGGVTGAPRTRLVLLIDADGTRSEVEAVVPKLAPGGSARVELAATLWNGTRIQAVADPRNELAEADESNNATPVQRVEGEPAPPQTVTAVPDLATEILRVEPGPPLKVRARVRNDGELTSPATIVTLTLATGATISEDVPPLRPGQAIEVTFEAGEAAELVVMVDPALAIAESDEANNRSDAPAPAATAQAQPVQTPPAEPAPVVVLGGTAWLVDGQPVLVVPESLGAEREIPGFRPGAPARPLAALTLADGSRLRFVENELVFTGSEAEAVALAERLGGEIVRGIERPAATGRPPTWLVAIDGTGTASLPPQGTAERAPVLVSSLAALNLLNVALQERKAGRAVSIDLVLEPLDVFPGDVFTGETIEAQGSNSSDWSYLKKGGPLDVNAVGAWQLLAIAGSPAHAVKVALLDSGFGTEPDLPPFTGTTDLYDPKDAAEGKAFHGANVASAIGGMVGNGIGAAGPAGAYVNLLFVQRTRTTADSIANLWKAAAAGAWIVNMSYGGYYVRGQDVFTETWPDVLKQFEADAVYMFGQDKLLFAAAGNEGWSVDQLDSDGNEFSWVFPCESQGVICVGGWKDDATRAYDSNYGEGRGETVDIYGPYKVLLGPDPLSPSPDTLQAAEGTSFASPFVAGVAALVWAANPALSNKQVWELLRTNVTLGQDGIPMVNAYRPVRQALLMLGGSHAPHVAVTVPAGGYAVANQYEPLRLTANAVDVEDGEACCKLAWVSDVDGLLGSGGSIEVPFAGKPPGTRVVTVTATDSAGLSSQATLTVDFGNAAPLIEIKLPGDGATLYSGLDYSFRAELHDDTQKLDLPLSDCSRVTWTSSNPADPKPLAAGCAPVVRFATAGARTVKASATDAYGATASDHVSLTVFAPGGAGSAPIALAITSPTEGSAFNVETRIPLAYQLSDPGAGGTKPKYQVTWRLGREGGEMRSFTPLKDGAGSYIRIEDVFPERKYDGSSEGYILHVAVADPARPGSASGTSVKIGFLPALH